jgi:hypothetical protein
MTDGVTDIVLQLSNRQALLIGAAAAAANTSVESFILAAATDRATRWETTDAHTVTEPAPDAPSENDDAVDRVVAALVAGRPYTYTSEADLHLYLGDALEAAGIGHTHEAWLDKQSRIDFLTVDGVGIEVKVAGSQMGVMSQLQRYADHDRVKGLVLVTTKADHERVPLYGYGVPVGLCSLVGQGL